MEKDNTNSIPMITRTRFNALRLRQNFKGLGLGCFFLRRNDTDSSRHRPLGGDPLLLDEGGGLLRFDGRRLRIDPRGMALLLLLGLLLRVSSTDRLVVVVVAGNISSASPDGTVMTERGPPPTLVGVPAEDDPDDEDDKRAITTSSKSCE